jgi:hypothetical protein
MKIVSAIIITFALLILFSPGGRSNGQNDEEKITADSVLAELKSGNEHHLAYCYQHPHETQDRVRESSSWQIENRRRSVFARNWIRNVVTRRQLMGDMRVAEQI